MLMQVMEAGKLKRESSDTHQQSSQTFQVAQEKVKKLNKGLKGAILKSRLVPVWIEILLKIIFR